MNEKRAKMLRRKAFDSVYPRMAYHLLKKQVVPRSPYAKEREAYKAELNA